MPPLNTILLVEDDPDIREIVIMALRDLGAYTVEGCSSGQEALERVAFIGPDLILLDVMMPGMDGPTTMKKFREIREAKDVPVIFMTARSQTHEVTEYLNLGAIEVIRKPFDPVTLSDDIKSIWDRHHG